MKQTLWLLVILALAIMPAQAQVSGYDPRFIDIDGNVTADDGNCIPPGTPCIDWLTKQTEQPPTLVGLTDGIGNNDGDILSPGSNLKAGSMLPKEDITRIWLANNSQYLYIAEERRANNGNSAYHLFMTQIAPTAVMGQPVVFHLQNGDIEIQICFPRGSDPAGKSIQVNQVVGVTGVLDVEAADIWDSGAFQPHLTAVTAFELNSVVVPALSGALDSKGKLATTYDVACFAEAAISLAAVGIDPCGSWAYASVITRSSCSLTSDVKDFCGPIRYEFGGPVVSEITKSVACDNTGTFTVTVTGGLAPYEVKWYDNEALIREVTLPGPSPATDTFEYALSPGQHTIRASVTDCASCPDDGTTEEFTVYEVLALGLSGPVIACDNTGCITATVSGGLGPYTYEWSDNGAPIATPTPPTSYCPTWTPGSHNVSLTVTDARGCSITRNTGPFTVYDLLAVTLSPPDIACDNTGCITATVSGGQAPFTYQWTDNGSPIATPDPPNSYCPAWTPGSHNIGVKVTDARGCTATSSTGPFTVYSPLSLELSGPVIDCENQGCVTASVSGGLGPYTYEWSDNGTPLATPTPPTSYCPTWTPGSHNVSLKVTDARGCSITRSTGPFSSYEILGVSVSGTADCEGVIAFTATPSGGKGPFTYVWKVDGVEAGTGAGFQYGPQADCTSHQVCVTVTDDRGCTANACKTVTQTVTTTGL